MGVFALQGCQVDLRPAAWQMRVTALQKEFASATHRKFLFCAASPAEGLHDGTSPRYIQHPPRTPDSAHALHGLFEDVVRRAQDQPDMVVSLPAIDRAR